MLHPIVSYYNILVCIIKCTVIVYTTAHTGCCLSEYIVHFSISTQVVENTMYIDLSVIGTEKHTSLIC